MNTSLSLLRWLFQRLTGLLLVIFLLIHIITIHFTAADAVSLQSVIERVHNNFFWFVFYTVFVLTTLWHGFNGLYEVVDDYKPSAFWNFLVVWGVWIIGIVLFLWGLRVLLMWYTG